MSDEVVGRHDFTLDRFQQEATAALDAGSSVLVSVPTGAGKTVVAEHAVALALAAGERAFYTTPIKALSNQKFNDLVVEHGAARVGLLTGDRVVNGDADVVVMTTEVLRNMIYAGSSALDRVRYVVLDEVHYLQDPYRGPVWEEVVVHAPHHIRLVCLSATVSNARELADWISSVRGPTTTVLSDHRPVPLDHHYVVSDRTQSEPLVLPVLVDGRANREGDRFDADRSWDDRRARSRSGRSGGAGGGRGRARHRTPRRLEVLDALEERSMLPAIFFIFSRAACDDATAACLDAGVRFTVPEERARIRAIAEHHVRVLTGGDLEVLGYDRWLAALEAGIAPHHAGLVPPFKEAVEQCFVEGLVKLVFATETLALGINMPARSVVIEKLTKFTGEQHEFLTPAEYTQLTGRAGRRGIDTEGHAVVLWSPYVRFEQVAALAGSRTYELRSAFRPTYNMAANLVHRYEPAVAHELLGRSFAQFQADRQLRRIRLRLEDRQAERAERLAEATCELGDVAEYRDLKARAAPRRTAPRGLVERGLAHLRPGDVLLVPRSVAGGTGDGDERVVVLSVAQRRAGASRLRAITPNRMVVDLGAADLPAPPEPAGRIEVPEPFAPLQDTFQRELVARLQAAELVVPARSGVPDAADAAAQLAEEHPVARCADRDEHLAGLERLERVDREIADLEGRIGAREGSIVGRFDRILQVLEGRRFLDGWSLSLPGQRLSRLYHESDLLIAESIEAGLLDGLDPPALAAVASLFTYEHRSSTAPPPPAFPGPEVARRWSSVREVWRDLAAEEEAVGLPPTREPDPGFCHLAHRWAGGDDLHRVLEADELSGGDFVRNARQLVDLLRQLGDVAPDAETAAAARAAAKAVFRGVVAAGASAGGGALAKAEPEVDDEVEPPPPTAT
jgi:ATP-dependent RNA helicase HelY